MNRPTTSRIIAGLMAMGEFRILPFHNIFAITRPVLDKQALMGAEGGSGHGGKRTFKLPLKQRRALKRAERQNRRAARRPGIMARRARQYKQFIRHIAQEVHASRHVLRAGDALNSVA